MPRSVRPWPPVFPARYPGAVWSSAVSRPGPQARPWARHGEVTADPFDRQL